MQIKVLITGAQGYIGSVLASYLLAQGREVMGLDTGFHASGMLYQDGSPQPRIAAKDIRKLRAEGLSGFDAVIHLAGLSNDPLGAFRPRLTRHINVGGTLRTAIAARNAGVARFINFSSCSVYGTSSNEISSKSCATNPLTEYSRCKLLSEAAINQLASHTFTVISMRNATVFGPSPRMRFDLVFNNLAGRAWTANEIRLVSDGNSWRPLIHIQDLARAAAAMLDAPRELVNRQVFNVGDDRLNYQVHEIAQAVSRAFPGCNLTMNKSSVDGRSYRVSFAKIRERLQFACEYDIESGAEELRHLFGRIGLTQKMFESSSFERLRRIKALISSREVDENLFWITGPSIADANVACTIAA